MIFLLSATSLAELAVNSGLVLATRVLFESWVVGGGLARLERCRERYFSRYLQAF
jgi:hypothetical protein